MRIHQRLLTGLAGAALALLICGSLLPRAAGAASDAPAYTIAVIPSSPPVQLYAQWAPFLERLTKETGLTFRLQLFDRMSEFERAIGLGSADFIFASPPQTVVAHDKWHYLPLVRGGKLVAVGLFVRKDSPIKTVNDLAGKTIAFVGNKNLCSIFVRHMLEKEELVFSTVYSGSTRNVIKSVLLGKSAAGAVFLPELAREPLENREQMQAIMQTPDMAPHPLCAHPRVPAAVRQRVTKAILELELARDGGQLLKAVRLQDPVAADYDRDYRHLSVIDVKRLTDWGK